MCMIVYVHVSERDREREGGGGGGRVRESSGIMCNVRAFKLKSVYERV